MAIVETPDIHHHAVLRDRAFLMAAIAALVIAVAALIYVIWLIVAVARATPFDADGVRCYSRADSMVCIKTAEPPR